MKPVYIYIVTKVQDANVIPSIISPYCIFFLKYSKVIRIGITISSLSYFHYSKIYISYKINKVITNKKATN